MQMVYMLAGGIVGWVLFESRREGPWAWTMRGRSVVLGKEFGEKRWSNMRKVPRELIGEQNVQAFLATIREKESRGNYRAIVFGGNFSSYADHPRIIKTRADGRKTSAAGAYQIVAKTWDGVKKEMGLTDFSPASQDMAALGLLAYRGALPYVIDGFFNEAVKRTNKEWVSLPGGSAALWTYEEARAYFVARGGRLAGAVKAEGIEGGKK